MKGPLDVDPDVLEKNLQVMLEADKAGFDSQEEADRAADAVNPCNKELRKQVKELCARVAWLEDRFCLAHGALKQSNCTCAAIFTNKGST